MKKVIFLLFCLPYFASADYIVKPFTLPSGIVYWAVQQVIGPIHVQATEMTEKEQYIQYAITMAQFYGFPENKFKAIISCESGWNPDAVGDKGKSIGILQWQKRSFKHYADKYKFDGEWLSPFDQMKLGAMVMGDIGSETDWTNCSKFYKTGSWDFLKK